MSNVRLRTSMAQARVDLERVSEKLQVDPKTVQRWLKGRIPHARHRWALAALVDEDEHYLWPPEDRGEPGASVELSWWPPTSTAPMSSRVTGGS